MLFDVGRKGPDDLTTTVVVMTDPDGALEGDGIRADHRIPDGPALDLFLAERITWEPHTDDDDDPDPAAKDALSGDLEAITETLLSSAAAGVFSKTFEAMEIAEDEIERASVATRTPRRRSTGPWEHGPLIEDLEISARRKAGENSRKLSGASAELAAA